MGGSALVIIGILATLLIVGGLAWLWNGASRSKDERHQLELEKVRLEGEVRRLTDELTKARHTRNTYNGLMDAHGDVVVMDKLLDELKARLWTHNHRLGQIKSGPYGYQEDEGE